MTSREAELLRPPGLPLWAPSRWIFRPFGAKVCSVVTEPSGIEGYSAPVYPHALSNYALGDFTC